jgi:hypothetical protein
MSFTSQYLYNIMVSVSRLISTFLGGHPNESISDRLGECAMACPEKQPFKFMRECVDLLLYIVAGEVNHCLSSVNGEPKAKELWKWDVPRTDSRSTDGPFSKE